MPSKQLRQAGCGKPLSVGNTQANRHAGGRCHGC